MKSPLRVVSRRGAVHSSMQAGSILSLVRARPIVAGYPRLYYRRSPLPPIRIACVWSVAIMSALLGITQRHVNALSIRSPHLSAASVVLCR